jgi:hypothetical protein
MYGMLEGSSKGKLYDRCSIVECLDLYRRFGTGSF